LDTLVDDWDVIAALWAGYSSKHAFIEVVVELVHRRNAYDVC